MDYKTIYKMLCSDEKFNRFACDYLNKQSLVQYSTRYAKVCAVHLDMQKPYWKVDYELSEPGVICFTCPIMGTVISLSDEEPAPIYYRGKLTLNFTEDGTNWKDSWDVSYVRDLPYIAVLDVSEAYFDTLGIFKPCNLENIYNLYMEKNS